MIDTSQNTRQRKMRQSTIDASVLLIGHRQHIAYLPSAAAYLINWPGLIEGQPFLSLTAGRIPNDAELPGSPVQCGLSPVRIGNRQPSYRQRRVLPASGVRDNPRQTGQGLYAPRSTLCTTHTNHASKKSHWVWSDRLAWVTLSNANVNSNNTSRLYLGGIKQSDVQCCLAFPHSITQYTHINRIC